LSEISNKNITQQSQKYTYTTRIQGGTGHTHATTSRYHTMQQQGTK